MKYVDGKNLENYCQDLKVKHSFNENIPTLLEIFKNVCLATSYAHSKNIVHLDIKPSNVIIGHFGEVFLCDWGLSEEINNIETSIHITKLSGTPGYLAPERLENVPTTQTMDVYSLGCLLYYLLTCKSPIDHSELTLFLNELKHHKIQPLQASTEHSIPNSLIQIFEKCCHKNPQDRYQGVNEIIDDINLYTNGYATRAESAGRLKNLLLLYKRNTLLFHLIFIFFILFSSTTILYIQDLKEKTNIAIQEKNKSDTLANTLKKKEEENQKFIDQLLDTADKSFKKERLSSSQYIIEDILLMPLKKDEALFKLAQISIGQFKWKKAQKCIDQLSAPHELSDKLQLIINKYSVLKNSIKNHYQLSLDVQQAGFSNLFNNLSADLIKKTYDKEEKQEHIFNYIKLENQLKSDAQIQYDKKNKELIIKDTLITKFRMMAALELDSLKLLHCHIEASFPKLLTLKHLDLKNSHFENEFAVNLSKMRTLIMPKNKQIFKVEEFAILKKLVLPNLVYKKKVWESLEKIIDFY